MNPLAPFLEKYGFVMLDGGISTELERQGADLEDPLWTFRVLLDAPEMIRRMHRRFLEAGADVIATTTYQASLAGLVRAGLAPAEAKARMRAAVAIAREERDLFWGDPANRRGRLRPLVAVSLGPYGACLHDGSEYHGNYEVGVDVLRSFHRERLEVLLDTPADLFAFETIPSLAEAKAILDVLPEFPGLLAWISFSCRDGRDVAHGERFADCLRAAAACPRIIAAGVNCTAPRHVSPLLRSAPPLGIPLVAYPNSGEEWDAGAQRWRGHACTAMDVVEWLGLGARLIGGCCRTGAEDIAAMRRKLLENGPRVFAKARGKAEDRIVE